ncbi:MAG: urate hydroxylase PuuD [Hyphomicrobiales bacterium]
MTAFLADWLNLLLRWAHLIVGIGWIGASFYFVALDFSLRRRERMPEGVYGTVWQVHGGGFYHVEKYLVAPKQLPDDLVWFQWEAYLTWVTGFSLLVVQYYLNASLWLIDPAKLPLLPWQAIALSVTSLAAGWFIYDALCRSTVGRNPTLLAALVFAMILAAAWFYTHVFAARGALIHVGAFIGTIMAANVFAVIIPNQKKITAALLEHRDPDPALGATGKQRSLHNTYLTLPVLVFMVSGHYPMLTGHPQAWILCGLIVVGGAALRYFLVRHEAGDPIAKVAWTLPVIAAALLAAMWFTAPRAATAVAGGVPDADVLAITQKHCVMCHAAKPTHDGFAEAPKGVMLETIEQVRRYAPLIEVQAVKTHVMPLGDETGITDEERARLGAWIAQQ